MVNEVNTKERVVGEGNFSIGSSVKGGLYSGKVDYNDMEKTREVIKKIRQMYSEGIQKSNLKADIESALRS